MPNVFTDTAFQPNAFQNNAFQIEVIDPDPIVTDETTFVTGTGTAVVRDFDTSSSGTTVPSGSGVAVPRRFDGWRTVS